MNQRESGDALLSGNGGFFGQHHGNVVANGIDAPAGLTFQPFIVRGEFYLGLAYRADKNVQKLLRDGHEAPPLQCRAVLGLYQMELGAGKRRFAVGDTVVCASQKAVSPGQAPKTGVF
jgi:hypothetical protein